MFKKKNNKNSNKYSISFMRVKWYWIPSFPNPEVKYKESRTVDPQHPPIKLKLGVGGEDRDLDLANFYSQVEFVKLKHPLSEKGIAFLGNSDFKVEYEKGGSVTTQPPKALVSLA